MEGHDLQQQLKPKIVHELSEQIRTEHAFMEENDYEVISDKEKNAEGKEESECVSNVLLTNSHQNNEQCNMETTKKRRWEELHESLRQLKEEVIEDCDEKITIEWNGIFDENYSKTLCGMTEYTNIKEENAIKREENAAFETDFSHTNSIDHDNSSYTKKRKKERNLERPLDGHDFVGNGEYGAAVVKGISKNNSTIRNVPYDRGAVQKHPKPFSCSVCTKTFPRKSDLMRHQQIHTRERPLACQFCNKHFTLTSSVVNHEKTHINQTSLTCEICNKSFTSKSILKRHAIVHTDFRPYTCTVCGKCFAYKYKLDSHEKTHMSNRPVSNNRPFACPACGKCFKLKGTLEAHHLRIHSSESHFSCEVCDKRFKLQTDLTRHKLCHTDVRPYTCGVCGNTFKGKRYLRAHVRRQHLGKKPTKENTNSPHKHVQNSQLPNVLARPYKCITCSSSFAYSGALKEHVLRLHTTDSLFMCEVCGKTFKCRGDYVRHLVCHSDARPHACEVCGKYFKERSKARRHAAQVHGRKDESLEKAEKKDSREFKELRFTCKICGKGFAVKCALTKHERVHTGERPFVCEVCGRDFASKHNLKVHMNVHDVENSEHEDINEEEVDSVNLVDQQQALST